ncbi:MAG: HAD hydrolase family protein [Candidatus Korobacteraceae bacterium]|jgi:3-deoxy-D-manno-octulosonate 8-phosphate phosphatase (KDO 8-P phosphatase)
MSRPRAKKIKLLILDVDGVMTDGMIYFFPDHGRAKQSTRKRQAKQADAGGGSVAGDAMLEIKGFHAHDGIAMSLARLGGLKTAVITKRVSETVRVRCRDLRIDYVYQGTADKLAALHEILRKERLKPEQAAYLGDDIVDLPAMRACGLAVAVANARESIKRIAHVVTEHAGGEGAVRDAVEYILKAQGTLDRVVAAYTSQQKPSDEA